MKTIEKLCKNCESLFDAPLREVKRGNGKFCSRKCSGEYQSKTRKPKPPNTKCAYCEAEFYMPPSKLSRSKSGLHFCCRAHKDAAQRLDYGLVEMHPPHYGSGVVDYRKLAFDTYKSKCSKCGYDKHPEILHVHHIDEDRTNNDISNLKILCPTCHDETHFLNKSGKWRCNTLL